MGVFVTGAAGYRGSNVVNERLATGTDRRPGLGRLQARMGELA
jgi:hypothetical protein